jgi:hypothetical protein
LLLLLLPFLFSCYELRIFNFFLSGGNDDGWIDWGDQILFFDDFSGKA